MRIHTDNVDAVRAAIYDAAHRLPGVYAETTAHGSRKRAGALELTVYADERPGRRPGNTMGPNSPGRHGVYAATWDEWGVIFAAIFAADPDATCYAYEGADHYHWTTGGRFLSGEMPAHRHDMHRWEHQGTSATGTYWTYTCRGRKGDPCDAIMRRVAYGHTWGEIAGS